MIYTVLGIDNNDGYDASAVPHDEQLEIEPRALSTIEQIFKVRKWDSARKRVHHGAIKVETRFRYHFGLLRPKTHTSLFRNHFRNRLRKAAISSTVNDPNAIDPKMTARSDFNMAKNRSTPPSGVNGDINRYTVFRKAPRTTR
jgi:hypothetical protein